MKVNDRGFTLIEVMVAAAMLGGLSLVFMQLTKDTTKSSTKFQMDSDITLTTNEINSILSDPQKCLTTFGSTATPTSIDGKFLTTSAGAPAQGYGNAGIKITNYTLTVAGNNGNLAIAYENKNILKGTSGPNSIIKNINLYVEGTPGAITKCRSLSTAASDIWRRQNPGSGIYFNEGNVGIGTTPTSDSLTVAGTITSTSGGIKFPDGSVQKSAPPVCTDATKALHWDGSAWSCDTLDFTAAITAAFNALFGGAPTPSPAPTPSFTLASCRTVIVTVTNNAVVGTQNPATANCNTNETVVGGSCDMTANHYSNAGASRCVWTQHQSFASNGFTCQFTNDSEANCYVRGMSNTAYARCCKTQ